MATAIVRTALSRAAISAAPRTSVAPKRSFSASAGHDDACNFSHLSLFLSFQFDLGLFECFLDSSPFLFHAGFFF